MPTPKISFEFFPPQSFEASFRLWNTVQTLSPLNPEFVSVTYGAGGTTRDLTHEAVTVLHRETGLNVAGHLTCVNATKQETLEIAKSYHQAGVTSIVALRGDAPKGQSKFTPHPDGFADSVELIQALADLDLFIIRVGAYPEKHPEAADQAQDIAWLKRKLDAGATEAITQFFFDAEDFLRFRDKCAAASIHQKIIPGILPIENWAGVQRFAARCGAKIPTWLAEAFDRATRDNRCDLLATAVCSELCSDLMDEGVQDLHFYTLNRPELTRDVCFALGCTPKLTLDHVA